MLAFLDGPANGQTLSPRRAPMMLRVVECRGQFDCLDQLADVAKKDERIHVYVMVGEVGWMHILCRGRNKAASGNYPNGHYRYLPEQPPDAVSRDNAAWAKWVMENVEALKWVRRKLEAMPDTEGLKKKVLFDRFQERAKR